MEIELKEYKIRLYNSNMFARRIQIGGQMFELDNYLKRFQYLFFFSRIVAYVIGLLIVFYLFRNSGSIPIIGTFIVFIVVTLLHSTICLSLTPDTIVDHFKKVKE